MRVRRHQNGLCAESGTEQRSAPGIAIGHPHIPLRLVLTFLPDGLQHLNGPLEGFVSLGFQSTFIMVPDDGVVLQRPCQGVGGAIVPPVLWDGIKCLDAAGVARRGE